LGTKAPKFPKPPRAETSTLLKPGRGAGSDPLVANYNPSSSAQRRSLFASENFKFLALWQLGQRAADTGEKSIWPEKIPAKSVTDVCTPYNGLTAEEELSYLAQR